MLSILFVLYEFFDRSVAAKKKLHPLLLFRPIFLTFYTKFYQLLSKAGLRHIHRSDEGPPFIITPSHYEII